ncbi:MAG: hypothetical protein H8F28_12845, partial [Fibrella sp.]|nr:hypothetical protein [Armatimonadota bacterium]
VRRVAEVVCPARTGAHGGLMLYATGDTIERFTVGAKHLLGPRMLDSAVETMRLSIGD